MWIAIAIGASLIVGICIGFILGVCWVAFYSAASDEEEIDIQDRDFCYSRVSQKQKAGDNSVQIQIAGIETVISKAETGVKK